MVSFLFNFVEIDSDSVIILLFCIVFSNSSLKLFSLILLSSIPYSS